jgi:peptide/nickel transport system substrate-binding protein
MRGASVRSQINITSRHVIVLLLVAGSLAVTACGSTSKPAGSSTPDSSSSSTTSSSGAAETTRDTLTVNLAGSNGTLDPAQACGSFDVSFVGNLYGRLTQYGSKPGPDGTTQVDPSKIEPSVAKSWEISDDGKTYTFTLNSGMKFPSGDPVDAKAVKYSFERAIDTGGCGQYFILDGLSDPPLIKSITAPDPETVVIQLRRADPNVLQDWAQPAAGIVDPKIVEQHGGYKKGVVDKWMQGHVAGYGPYLMEKHVPGKSALLKANPNFVGTPPAVEHVQVNFIGDDATLLLRARSGDADVTLGLSKQAAKSLSSHACCRLVVNDTTQSLQIMTPSKSKPFDNAKFREAMTYAIPYEDILSKVAYGYGSLFYGPYTPAMPEFDATIEAPRTHDPEKAKALLQESGVKTPVNVEMIINGAAPLHEQLATIVQGAWRPLGVNVKISKLSTADFETRINKRDYQLGITRDGPGVIDAGYYLGYDMKCDNAFNSSGICIPAADKLLEQARTETDPGKRMDLYHEIAKLWVAASPKIPVFADREISVLSERMKDYFYSHEMDFRTWSF